MSQFRVVCTEQTNNCPERGHILSVGTGSTPGAASLSWTVDQVWAAIERGDFFYTYADGRTATVDKYLCPRCGRRTLRTRGDTTVANNLDNLPLCPWRAA